MLPSVSLFRDPGISLLRGPFKTTQQSDKVTEGTANWSTLQSLVLEQNNSLAIELQGLIKLDEIWNEGEIMGETHGSTIHALKKK